MEINRISVPGGGVLHELRTRSGQPFRVLIESTGPRRIYVDDPDDADAVVATIDLEPDEADTVADLLHSSPIIDRVASLERRLGEHLEVRQRERDERDAHDSGPPGPGR